VLKEVDLQDECRETVSIFFWRVGGFVSPKIEWGTEVAVDVAPREQHSVVFKARNSLRLAIFCGQRL
jgi:hypothetical protein